jgi:hypothetical protein
VFITNLVAGNITYEPGHGWRFEYDHVADDKADSLKIFLRDLRGVTRMTALANGLESGSLRSQPTQSHLGAPSSPLADTLSPTFVSAVLSNAAQYGHLLRYFEVHRFTPTHLVLHFDEVNRTPSL